MTYSGVRLETLVDTRIISKINWKTDGSNAARGWRIMYELLPKREIPTCLYIVFFPPRLKISLVSSFWPLGGKEPMVFTRLRPLVVREEPGPFLDCNVENLILFNLSLQPHAVAR